VRKAVEAAAQEYLGGADRDRLLHEVYNTIARQGKSRGLEKYCTAILQLENFPLDQDAKTLVQLGEQIQRSSSRADVLAAVYLSTARHGRLLSCLSLAWTGPGKGSLPTSDTGTFVDFMSGITAYILPEPLQGAGVKHFVKRERERRDLLWVSRRNKWKARIEPRIDESKIFLLDQFGRQKS
jgi:hypothetical protein